ncbi:hypothetical protein ABR737_01360 [Streptomyces sp. Edi2]|uniref:hypothetical protein n=1 Tax=Streptomyces sp. Edi2 TaxID=3162528 RepID=UPI003305C7B3
MTDPIENERRQIVAAAIRRQDGPWTKKRTMRVLRAAGLPGPYDSAARRVLAHHHETGLLDRHETPGRRFYTRKDDAQ